MPTVRMDSREKEALLCELSNWAAEETVNGNLKLAKRIHRVLEKHAASSCHGLRFWEEKLSRDILHEKWFKKAIEVRSVPQV